MPVNPIVIGGGASGQSLAQAIQQRRASRVFAELGRAPIAPQKDDSQDVFALLALLAQIQGREGDRASERADRKQQRDFQNKLLERQTKSENTLANDRLLATLRIRGGQEQGEFERLLTRELGKVDRDISKGQSAGAKRARPIVRRLARGVLSGLSADDPTKIDSALARFERDSETALRKAAEGDTGAATLDAMLAQFDAATLSVSDELFGADALDEADRTRLFDMVERINSRFASVSETLGFDPDDIRFELQGQAETASDTARNKLQGFFDATRFDVQAGTDPGEFARSVGTPSLAPPTLGSFGDILNLPFGDDLGPLLASIGEIGDFDGAPGVFNSAGPSTVGQANSAESRLAALKEQIERDAVKEKDKKDAFFRLRSAKSGLAAAEDAARRGLTPEQTERAVFAGEHPVKGAFANMFNTMFGSTPNVGVGPPTPEQSAALQAAMGRTQQVSVGQPVSQVIDNSNPGALAPSPAVGLGVPFPGPPPAPGANALSIEEILRIMAQGGGL